MKLNGVIIPLQAGGESNNARRSYAAEGVTMTVRMLGDEGDWRADAQLAFAMQPGPQTGYRGFFTCG